MKNIIIKAVLTAAQLDYLKSLAAQNNISIEVYVQESETATAKETPVRTPLTDEHIAQMSAATGRSLRSLLELQEQHNIETLEEIINLNGCPSDIYDVVENILEDIIRP